MLACSRNNYICCPSLHRDHTVADIIGLSSRMRASALIAEAGYGADGGKADLFAQTADIPSLKAVHRLLPVTGNSRLWPPGDDAASPRDGRSRYDRLSRLHVWHDGPAQGRHAFG